MHIIESHTRAEEGGVAFRGVVVRWWIRKRPCVTLTLFLICTAQRSVGGDHTKEVMQDTRTIVHKSKGNPKLVGTKYVRWKDGGRL